MSVSSDRVALRALCLAAALLLFLSGFGSSTASAQTLGNDTPGFIKNAKDLGEADLGAMMTATVWLKLHNENLLDRLTTDQYNKSRLVSTNGFRRISSTRLSVRRRRK
jgi:hypothetical protein